MSKFTDLLRRFLGVDGGPRRSVASPSPGGGAPHQGSEKAASVSLRAALAATHQSTPNTELTPLTYMPRAVDPFAPVAPLPAQIEAGASEMAFDSAMFPSIADAYFNEGIGFFGYQTLAQLSQRAEYRKMIEILALDMTREWIRFTYTGDGEGDRDAQDKIAAIDKRFRELQVQDKFRQVAEMDGLFGRGHIHINLGDANDPAELKSRLVVDPRKIKKGGLKRLTVVDPTWTYPGVYNSTDPLAPYFYVPETWYVMNKEVHESRLLTFVSRPLPDILKAAYAFGGVSLTQMAKPYVDNWLQMRQSVADLVQAFSVFILKTDMSAVMNGTDATSLQLRAELFNVMRKNNGLMMLNKAEAQGDPGEDLTNIAVPLAGLNELLSSAQEQMSFVSGLPLVKLLGVTPSGLNASSDGEVRVYYDTVAAQQESIFRAPLETILQIVQLDQFGEIDEDIGIEFMPLWQMDEAQQATARKADADTDIAYVNAGVLSPEEVREKLTADKASFWTNLDTSDVPETPEEQRDLAEGEKDLAEADKAEAEAGQPKPIEVPQAKDERIRDRYKLHNFDIVIETPRGKKRQGTDYAGKPWECTMAADYGYIDGTWSTEGRSEGMDCFIGPDTDSQKVFVIDQGDLQTGQFDEHKCMIGFGSQKAAVRAYLDSYDSRGVERIMDVTEITMNAFRHWLENGDLYRPISPEAYDVTRPATGAMDAGEFKEADHPRAKNGQFGSGGGGESGKASEAGSGQAAKSTSAKTKASSTREASGLSGGEAGENKPMSSALGSVGSLTPAARAAATAGVSKPVDDPQPYFPADKVADLPHPNNVRSPAGSWEEANAMGAVGREQFKDMLDKVADKMGLSTDLATPDDLKGSHTFNGKSYVFLGPNKSEKRAAEKVNADYGGDWTKLKDMVRATIAVETVDQIREAVAELEKAGVTFAAKPKDNINTVKPEGYRDLNTLVRLPNGMLAELQLNVKSMIASKQAGHVLYEDASALERKHKGPPDATWPTEDREKWNQLMVQQRAVYDPAWKAAGGKV